MNNEKKRRHRACVACNQRKVQCNGQQRCQQCEHLNLPCEYVATAPRQIRRKNTAKQARASVDAARHVRELAAAPQHLQDIDRSIPSASNGDASIEDSEFFLALLPDFETFVLPFHPVITIPEAQYAIATMAEDREARAFVYGLVAVTLNLTDSLRSRASPKDSDIDEKSDIDIWVSRCLNALQPVLLQEDISVRRVATLQFIHVSLMGLGRHELAFYYLRQSTTMVEILRIGDAGFMTTLPLEEQSRRQWLYWLVFVRCTPAWEASGILRHQLTPQAQVHERFYAVTCQRPIVLPPLLTIPEVDAIIPRAVTNGFTQIVRLFMHIDQDMLSKWFATFDSGQGIEPAWIVDKHRQIDAEVAGTGDEIVGLSRMQQADLVITKHWLKMLVWQMAMSKCLLSSATSEHSMSLLFPVGVSGQLRTLIGNMTKYDIEVHGSGIQQKLFELTHTIASVVLTVPAASIEEKRRRVDDFEFLFDFWKSLPRPNPVQMELLDSKYRRLAEIQMDV